MTQDPFQPYAVQALFLWISTYSGALSTARALYIFFIFSILHNSHEVRRLRDLCDRMPGNDLQPLHQHPVLIIRDSHSLIRCPWPAERTVIQSFIQEKEPVTFPQKRFDPVIPSSTEEEERIFIIWIKRILKADDGCQTIDPTAEIREARCQINFLNLEAQASFSMAECLYQTAEHFRRDRCRYFCRKSV